MASVCPGAAVENSKFSYEKVKFTKKKFFVFIIVFESITIDQILTKENRIVIDERVMT